MVVFSDGLEVDFSNWTGTTGAPAIQGATVHTGVGAESAAMTGINMCYKTVADASTYYARAYVRFSALTANADWKQLCLDFMDAGTAYIAQIGIRSPTSNNADWHFCIIDRVNAHTHTGATHVVAGQWYCLELAVFINAAGWVKGWIDGVAIDGDGHIDPANLAAVAHASQVRLGALNSGLANTMYCDCAVVDVAYIGPESAGGMQLFTLLNEENY